MTRAAIIVGAGIGGLTAAIALRRIGWTVTVLERALRFDAVGAGLSLAPNAMRGLDAIGVGSRVRTVGVPTAAASAIRRPDGRFLIRTRQAPETLPLLAYQRAALHRDLLGALPPECVRLDAEVLGVDPAPPSPSVQLCDGNLKADLVVAADGIHSRIRRQHWPDATEEFLNYAAWVGLADLDEPVGPGTESGLAGSMTLSRGRYFLIHPVGPQRVYWALGERADDAGVRSEDELAQVRSRVGGWHDPIPRLLDATPPDRVKRLDIQAVPELPTYVRGSLVLLGDAAHAMSPDRGQGAGQSIEDAVVLASLLSESTAIKQALQAYDSIRRPRAQMVARDAQRVGQSIINAGPLSYRLMAAMLGLMPAGLWKWFTRPDGNAIWGWRPPIVPDRQG